MDDGQVVRDTSAHPKTTMDCQWYLLNVTSITRAMNDTSSARIYTFLYIDSILEDFHLDVHQVALICFLFQEGVFVQSMSTNKNVLRYILSTDVSSIRTTVAFSNNWMRISYLGQSKRFNHFLLQIAMIFPIGNDCKIKRPSSHTRRYFPMTVEHWVNFILCHA